MAIDQEPAPTAMLTLQSLELWMLDRKKDARAALIRAGKLDSSLGNSEEFCRLIFCDARDIGPVGEFLHKNRSWLNPPAEQERGIHVVP